MKLWMLSGAMKNCHREREGENKGVEETEKEKIVIKKPSHQLK